MIIDITGIKLTPGNAEKECLGNGKHKDSMGKLIPICCDECEYLMCCISENLKCKDCNDSKCPRNKNNRTD